MSEYPEHDKLSAVQEKSQIIGEFLDWASQQGMHLMVHRPKQTWGGEPFVDRVTGEPTDQMVHESGRYNKDNPEYHVEPAAYFTVHKTINELLAEFYEVDLKKLSEEKEEMLSLIRRLNTEKDAA